MVEFQYYDIIRHSRPVSERHARMSMLDRGAQFAPFAALVGFEGVIREHARLTEAERFLDEDSWELLNRQLRYAAEHPDAAGEVTFRCYVPDSRKSGGAYVSVTGKLKKLDINRRQLRLEDGREIALDSVCAIEGNWEEEAP